MCHHVKGKSSLSFTKFKIYFLSHCGGAWEEKRALVVTIHIKWQCLTNYSGRTTTQLKLKLKCYKNLLEMGNFRECVLFKSFRRRTKGREKIVFICIDICFVHFCVACWLMISKTDKFLPHHNKNVLWWSLQNDDKD